ncbi:MAG: sigma 54-interacting transcriptional regulator [Geobacteraceae bacterium]|nr:sigma 54-interacting transcriptional regulator [Geobacteraceae bacterium]NTW80741.1 sigma 54-interacting transcriptional regulator [Geobacteraceae bacterium]
MTLGVKNIPNTKESTAILDSLADGVFTIDSQMRIQFFSRAAEEITGFPHEDAIGQHYNTILRFSKETFACPVQETLETGAPVLNRGLEIIGRNNHKKHISISTSVLCDSDGDVCGSVAVIHDLSSFYPLKNAMLDKLSFQHIVSRNPSMRRLFDVTADIAASEATVFLHGESGTGKELFARAIHELSPRKKGPLIIVNCGALPENLCESEIFGVRKGAYTGATENRQGRLELCSGGTFFLDEIGDLPLSLQVKLLRVLENKEFQPLGAKAPMKADVRFITATHRNLEEMVEAGTFRRDLYFRINIVQLNIPPLRERKEDIPLLLDMNLKKFNQAYSKNINCVSPEVLNLLLAYDFPGNVRELQNLVEQSVVLCKGGEITLDHMPTGFKHGISSNKGSRQRSSKAPEAEVLSDLIARHQGNRTEAAQELGVDRSTLWRWVRNAGLAEM